MVAGLESELVQKGAFGSVWKWVCELSSFFSLYLPLFKSLVYAWRLALAFYGCVCMGEGPVGVCTVSFFSLKKFCIVPRLMESCSTARPRGKRYLPLALGEPRALRHLALWHSHDTWASNTTPKIKK